MAHQRSTNMTYDSKSVDDFTKPSRQNRGGRKRRDQNRNDRPRNEPYKRQRFQFEGVDDSLDEDVNY
jgi:hypothetical protein